MSEIPTRVSESVRRLNPHLYGGGKPAPTLSVMVPVNSDAVKRLRQKQGPVMNKLETEFYNRLVRQVGPNITVHAQSWRVRIANGAWFKVDMCAFIDGKWTAWEVKGNAGKNIDRGKLALKVAATSFPEIEWHIVWKTKDGQWHEQKVLP